MDREETVLAASSMYYLQDIKMETIASRLHMSRAQCVPAAQACPRDRSGGDHLASHPYFGARGGPAHLRALSR